MIQKELQRLHKDPNFITHYWTFLDSFKKSGMLEVFRLLGQPIFIGDGKDPNIMAAQAARSAGWNAAIYALLNFEELLDASVKQKTTPTANFNALDDAVKRGDILKEERDAIELGKPLNPAIYKPKQFDTSKP